MPAEIADFEKLQYPRVGYCIYCGSTEDLRREHIIPFGLGGTATLPEASCKNCERITGQFEGNVLRGSMWPARTLSGIRSRRPGDAPSTYPLTIVRNGVTKEVQLPVEEYPVLLPMPIFKPPGYLTGEAQGTGINVIGIDTLCFENNPQDVGKRLGASEIKVSARRDKPTDFARMLAKIGYSFTVATVGREKIKENYVVPMILGQDEHFGTWVGTIESGNIFPSLLHRLKITLQGEGNLIVTEVQLFAQAPGPTYGVVVGRIEAGSIVNIK